MLYFYTFRGYSNGALTGNGLDCFFFQLMSITDIQNAKKVFNIVKVKFTEKHHFNR